MGTGPAELAYRALVDDVYALYGEQRYADAVSRIRRTAPELPRWRADTAHLAACLLALDGQPRAALAELKAALDAGSWWHPRILLEDDDLTDVRALPGFDALAAETAVRHRAAEETPRAPIVRRPPGDPRGVVVALHGAGEDAELTAEQWSGALGAGFVLVTLDSSQRNTPTYRSWPDPHIAARDIAAALGAAGDAVSRLPVIAGGFSAGGRQAMLWALSGIPVEVVGFLAVAPAIHPEQLPDGLVAASARRVRGVMLLGDADSDVSGGALATGAALGTAGLSTRIELLPGHGHGYPDDFPTRLAGALRELLPPGPGPRRAVRLD